MSRIAITLGDPNGVGPEILVKAAEHLNKEHTYVVYGDEDIVRMALEKNNISAVSVHEISAPEDAVAGVLNVVSVRCMKRDELEPGTLSKKAGEASLEYIRKASEDALRKRVDAVVTLPVNKEAVRLANPDFTGHTGYIAKVTDSNKKPVMLLAGEKLHVSHVSTHCSLLEAVRRVKKERICEVIRLTWEALQMLKCGRQELAVAALNPHAGEGGAFGDEEQREIIPAIEEMIAEGIPLTGPIPPDTVFYSALKGSYSGVICMYHDQGHIPMKTVDFEGGVNISLGLPILRTSVDHGTAFDIAWRGRASTKSFLKAVEYAELLVRGTAAAAESGD